MEKGFLTVQLVIIAGLVLIVVILTVLYWCCSRSEEDRGPDKEHLEDYKAQCIRLQINSDSDLDLSRCVKIFLNDDNQPPPYDPPPSYKSIMVP